MYEILKYFEYQFIDVYNAKINYYEIFFNMFFMVIIIILLIVFYWDNIYKKAKKKSKCNDILTIIEDNGLSSKPYLYSIIIIDNDIINSNNNNYLLKITYDFKNMKTIIEYGTDDGIKNEVLLSEIIDADSETKHDNAKEVYNNAKNAYEAKKPASNDDILIYTIAIDTYELARKEYEKESDDKKSKNRYNYFDLRKMNTNYIEGIDMKIINSHKYKYIAVDNNNNKRKKNFTSEQLLFFTKGYSYNLNYNTEIIYDIKFAKDNKNKLTI